MKVTYDEDMAYVELGRGEVAKTHEVAPGILLDVDASGQAVGLEIVGLSERGLAPGVIEVELARRTPDADDKERRLTEAMFGTGGRRAQAH